MMYFRPSGAQLTEDQTIELQITERFLRGCAETDLMAVLPFCKGVWAFLLNPATNYRMIPVDFLNARSSLFKIKTRLPIRPAYSNGC